MGSMYESRTHRSVSGHSVSTPFVATETDWIDTVTLQTKRLRSDGNITGNKGLCI